MTFLPGLSLHLFLQCIIKTNYIVSVSSFTRLIITSVMIFINLFFSFVLPSNSFCQTWNLLATLIIQIGKKNVRKMSTSAKRVSAPMYLLLPLGKWGSKWGVFNHEKGAIWQSHLATQKEGVVTTIIFSNHKSY